MWYVGGSAGATDFGYLTQWIPPATELDQRVGRMIQSFP